MSNSKPAVPGAAEDHGGRVFRYQPAYALQRQRCACSIDRPPGFPPPGKGPQRTDRSQQLYGLVPGALVMVKSFVR
jgi:hypothetical protein